MKKDTRNYGKFHSRFAEGGAVGQLESAYGCKGTSTDPYICKHPNAEKAGISYGGSGNQASSGFGANPGTDVTTSPSPGRDKS